MVPNQNYKFLHNKGNHKKKKRQPKEWEKIIANDANDNRSSLQNIQITHTTQQQKQQTIQLENGQKTRIDISLKKT